MEHPNSPDAERAVLGSILLNRDAIAAVAAWLHPEDFYYAKHGVIYRAMRACFEARTPPDVRLVSERLRVDGQLETIGGIAYLSELVGDIPTSHHITYYGRIVEQTAIRRNLITAGGAIAALGFDAARPLDDVLADAQTSLAQAARRRQQTARPVADVMTQIYGRLSDGVLPGLPTGLFDLDRLTGGLRPSKLYILGGRPGNGKTSLALSIAVNIARRGAAVKIFSLEMGADELGERLISMESGIDTLALSRYSLNDDNLHKAIGAMKQVSGLPITIDDTGALSLPELRARTAQHISERGQVDLVIVDYLTLMTIPMARGDNRAAAVGAVANGLKAMSKEFSCPVLCLAQLNRDLDRRGSPVPELADLRESGDIEAAADLVGFIVRPELYDKGTDKKGIAELWIRKQRGGPTGMIELRFDAPTTRFDNLTKFRAVAGYEVANAQ